MTMLNLLLPDIISNILSRLPVESVLQCRQVCKTWNTLIRPTYFADMHLHRCHLGQFDDDHHNYHNNHSSDGMTANVGLGLVFSIKFKSQDRSNVGLYFGEYDKINNDEQFSYKKLTKINHPPLNNTHESYKMVGSRNGLICFSKPYSFRKGAKNDHVYICNPITREHKKYYDASTQGLRSMVTGFGYLPSSKEYKIVRIYHWGLVQVYTLGSGTGWRNKGKITGNLINYYNPPVPCANGALYWLDYKDMKILAFDLANEEFHLVPSPPCLLPAGTLSMHNFTVRELGRCLCIVDQVRFEHVEIWSFKKTKNSTTTSRTKEEEYQSWTWSREFSISWEGPNWHELVPLALTRSGEVLLWLNHNILCCYDPKTATLKKLVQDDVRDVRIFQAIPHMNSFVSLKELGERQSTKRKRYIRKYR